MKPHHGSPKLWQMKGLDDRSLNDGHIPVYGCTIQTPEGRMHAKLGDYIIQGVNGEMYPCKPDIFLKTYEKSLGRRQS